MAQPNMTNKLEELKVGLASGLPWAEAINFARMTTASTAHYLAADPDFAEDCRWIRANYLRTMINSMNECVQPSMANHLLSRYQLLLADQPPANTGSGAFAHLIG